ncbi:MAG: hypothetical protein LKF31_05900 [Muribaculaceae bacterium]|jgi:hypothetical protein|nr:hypothetical protein [Muribaculaceae bacterium]
MQLNSNSIFKEDEAMIQLFSIFEKNDIIWKLSIPQQSAVFDAKMRFLENGNVQIDFIIPLNIFEKFNMNSFFDSPVWLLEPMGTKLLFMWKNIVGFNISIDNNNPIRANVEYSSFQTDNNLKGIHWQEGKYAIYNLVNKDKAISIYTSGIKLEMTSNSDQNSQAKNLLSFELFGMQFCFYELPVSGNKLLFVLKSQKILHHDEFLNVRDAVIAAYALITGSFLGSSGYLISLLKDKDFILEYTNNDDVMISNCPLIDNGFYKDDFEEKLRLPANIFGNLVNLLYQKEPLRRACLLITQAGVAKGITRGSIAAVALETIAEQMGIKNENEPCLLIKDKNIASQLKYELKKGLKKIKGKVDKAIYDKLMSKIGQINQLPNALKLEDPFRILGIELNDEEKYCLDSRNFFLHGTFPKPKNKIYINLNQYDLVYIVGTRLMMLGGILLLKKAGYNGSVVDYGYTFVIKQNYLFSGRYNEIRKTGYAHRTIASFNDVK